MYIFFLLGIPLIILFVGILIEVIVRKKKLMTFRFIIIYFILLLLYSIILGILTHATNIEDYFYGKEFPSLILSKVSSYMLLSCVLFKVFSFFIKRGK